MRNRFWSLTLSVAILTSAQNSLTLGPAQALRLIPHSTIAAIRRREVCVASHLGSAIAEGEVKGGALVHSALGPNLAAMPVNDAPHGGEPDASAWERSR
jgi:hypothetical protein